MEPICGVPKILQKRINRGEGVKDNTDYIYGAAVAIEL